MTSGQPPKPTPPGFKPGVPGTPLCATCGARPAAGIDKYTEATVDSNGRRRRSQKRVPKCSGAGCHRGTWVRFPWAYPLLTVEETTKL